MTKCSAEDLCELMARNNPLLNILILKTSRFFPENDDNEEIYQLISDDANIKVNEFLYRRVELEDVITAHLLAGEKAYQSLIHFSKFIITSSVPFQKSDLEELRSNPSKVIQKYYLEDYEKVYQSKGWKMFPSFDRMYINEKARRDLGWVPKYDFQYLLNCLKGGKPIKSEISQLVGSKGYHRQPPKIEEK